MVRKGGSYEEINNHYIVFNYLYAVNFSCICYGQ